MTQKNIRYFIYFCGLFFGILVTNLSFAQQAVWIDSDPACGHGKSDDVDDCWAILLAMQSEELEIRGFSTLFGNGPGDMCYETAVDLIQRFGDEEAQTIIFRGADYPLDKMTPLINDASQALAIALKKEPLTIIALGPLTNIARLILLHPEQVKNIKQVIAVAGMRPGDGHGFYPGSSRFFHLHDLNFRKDVTAFEIVLNSPVPLTLVPYEVAAKIKIKSNDLSLMENGGPQAQWLAEISNPWLGFWKKLLKADGFFPFDSLAIGYLTSPSLYHCEDIPIEIQRKRSLWGGSNDKLLVSHEFVNRRIVNYCYDINPSFKVEMIGKLIGLR